MSVFHPATKTFFSFLHFPQPSDRFDDEVLEDIAWEATNDDIERLEQEQECTVPDVALAYYHDIHQSMRHLLTSEDYSTRFTSGAHDGASLRAKGEYASLFKPAENWFNSSEASQDERLCRGSPDTLVAIERTTHLLKAHSGLEALCCRLYTAQTSYQRMMEDLGWLNPDPVNLLTFVRNR
jgi:hypothetical protein